jgi:hypothetical protein
MTAEVIKFPGNMRVPPLSAEGVVDSIMTMKLVHAQEALIPLVAMVFERLAAAGFILPDTEDEHLRKQAELVVEGLHSIMLGYYNIDHPFQKMSQSLFVIDKDGEVDLAESIEMSFEKGYPKQLALDDETEEDYPDSAG